MGHRVLSRGEATILFGERKSADAFVEAYVANAATLDELDDQAPTWVVEHVANKNQRRTRHAVTFAVSVACDSGAIASDLARKVSQLEHDYLLGGYTRTYGWKLHDGTEGTIDTIVSIDVEKLTRWQERQRQLTGSDQAQGEPSAERPVRGSWS